MFFVMYTLETQTDTKKKQNFFFHGNTEENTGCAAQCSLYVLYSTPFSINPAGGPNNSFLLDFTEKGVF